MRIHLEFEEHRCFLSEWASDLGEGGVFVSSEYLFPPGTPVRFECRLGRGGPVLDGEGEVAWIRETGQEGTETGLGLRIVALTPPNRDLLQRALAAVSESGGDGFDLQEFASRESGVDPVVEDPTEELVEPAPTISASQLDDTAPLQSTAMDPAVDEPSQQDDSEELEPTDVIAEPGGGASPSSESPVPDMELRQGPLSGELRSQERSPPPGRSHLWIQALAILAVLLLVGGFYLLRQLVVPSASQKEPTAPEESSSRGYRAQGPLPEVVLEIPPPEEAQLAAQPSPNSSSGGFRQVVGIRVQAEDSETYVVIETDGEVSSDRFAHYRLDGPSPREVIQLFHLSAPQRAVRMAVGGPLVRQVRTGFHNHDEGNELRVVLDLQTAAAHVAGIEVEGSVLRVRIAKGQS